MFKSAYLVLVLLITQHCLAQKITPVAPGVWKVVYGEQEKIKPGDFKEETALDGLKQLPAEPKAPAISNTIRFKQVAGGITAELNLEDAERIYGFGLQVNTFEQRGLRREIRTNSWTIGNIGFSHAPLPFYISSNGYGVLVNTSRYVNFYVGSQHHLSESVNIKKSIAEPAEPGSSPSALYSKNYTSSNKVQVQAGTSSATIIDTNATTLRFIYVIPEAARGKQVTFSFSSTDRAGNRASTSTPAYTVAKMNMVRNIPMVGTATGSRYFSIDLMRSFTQAQVDSGNLSSKIDFIYAYSATVTPGVTPYAYGHALISPATAATYIPPGVTIPAAWIKNTTLMEKKIGTTVYDGQLKGDANSNIYVDDLDLQKQTFEGSANFSLGLANDGSVFMKTADGKYTAFVYMNSVTNASTTAVISMKRYTN